MLSDKQGNYWYVFYHLWYDLVLIGDLILDLPHSKLLLYDHVLYVIGGHAVRKGKLQVSQPSIPSYNKAIFSQHWSVLH